MEHIGYWRDDGAGVGTSVPQTPLSTFFLSGVFFSSSFFQAKSATNILFFIFKFLWNQQMVSDWEIKAFCVEINAGMSKLRPGARYAARKAF